MFTTVLNFHVVQSLPICQKDNREKWSEIQTQDVIRQDEELLH